MARKSQITVGSRAEEQKNRIAAWLRDNPGAAKRLAGNIFGGGSVDIPMKEQGWYTRIDNTLADDANFYKMVHQLGYQPVTKDDLTCDPKEIGFFETPDGSLTRNNGKEMIFKMPVEVRELIEAKATATNLKGQGSAKDTRDALAEKVAGAFGDQAADFMAGQPGHVIDSIASVGEQ